MTKEQVSAIIFEDASVQWATALRVRNRALTIRSGTLELQPEKPAGDTAKPVEPAEPAQPATETTPEAPTADGQKDEAQPAVVTPDSHLRELARTLKGPLTLALSSDQVLLRVVQLPAAAEDEIAGMVNLQIDKFSPFPIETMVVSHEVLQKGPDGWTVLIAAVKEEIVLALGAQLQAAGLVSARVDVTTLGWWAAIARTGDIPAEGRHVLLLSTNHRVQILVAENGIPIALRALTGGHAASSAEEIAEEVRYTLMSLEMERGSADTGSVLLVHEGPPAADLLSRLQETCGCEIRCRAIDSLPPLAESLAQRALDPAGSILDLTPSAWRAAETKRQFRRRMMLSVGITAGAWALLVAGLAGALYIQKFRCTLLTRDRDQWAKPAEEIRDMRRRVAMLTPYADRSGSALECLREISLLQPQGIDLTSFSYKRMDGGTNTVSIIGEADSNTLILQFNEKLNSSALFREVTSGGASRGPAGRYRFNFDMQIQNLTAGNGTSGPREKQAP